MLDWLIVILVVAPICAALYYLERTHAPVWQTWAVWIGSGMLTLGIAGASLYPFQAGYIITFVLLGAFVGAAGALRMEWPLIVRRLWKHEER